MNLLWYLLGVLLSRSYWRALRTPQAVREPNLNAEIDQWNAREWQEEESETL